MFSSVAPFLPTNLPPLQSDISTGNVGNLPLVLISSLGSDPGLPFLLGTGGYACAVCASVCVRVFSSALVVHV